MNQQFYLAVNGVQTGPFNYEEIKTKGIHRYTLIWTEGLENWTKAEQVEALKDLIRTMPPPVPNEEKKQQMPPPITPNSWRMNENNCFGYELSRRRERFFAFFIQKIIIFLPISLIIYVSMDVSDPSYFVSYIIGIVLYAIIGAMFYPMWSGNLGHKIMGLKVISSENGSDQFNAGTGVKREVLKGVFSIVIIPIIWLLWDENRQNLYDKVSKTIVVKKKPGQ